MGKKQKKRNRPQQPANSRVQKIANGAGPPCHRCGQTTQRWRWSDFRLKSQETGRPAFRWWFECLNRSCQTTLIMPKDPAARYYPGQQEDEARPAQEFEGLDTCLADAQQWLSHFRSI